MTDMQRNDDGTVTMSAEFAEMCEYLCALAGDDAKVQAFVESRTIDGPGRGITSNEVLGGLFLQAAHVLLG